MNRKPRMAHRGEIQGIPLFPDIPGLYTPHSYCLIIRAPFDPVIGRCITLVLFFTGNSNTLIAWKNY